MFLFIPLPCSQPQDLVVENSSMLHFKIVERFEIGNADAKICLHLLDRA